VTCSSFFPFSIAKDCEKKKKKRKKKTGLKLANTSMYYWLSARNMRGIHVKPQKNKRD